LDAKQAFQVEMILSTHQHEMHHPGQLTVVERMLGIVPHITRAKRDAEVSQEDRHSN